MPLDIMASEVFSKVLRAVRESKNLSQEKLAEFSNLDPVTIYRYESGAIEPSLSKLFKLCKGLEISVSEFTELLSKNGYSG